MADKKEDKKEETPKAEAKAEKPKAEKKPAEAKAEAKSEVAAPADAGAQQAEAKADAEPESKGPQKAPETFRVVLGRKVGMTQRFDEHGDLRAVTVVEAGPCSVVRVKDAAGKDGYCAVLLGFGPRTEKSMSKPLSGQFKAAGVAPVRHLKEFRLGDVSGFSAGQVVDLEGRFSAGDYVDVQGLSKGKGFASAIKRHNFAGLPATHGTSDKERSPGSISSRRSLGRILPGQRMAGHMGQETITTQKIEVVAVEPGKNRIFLGGSVPGAKGTVVVVRETVKQMKHRKAEAKKKELTPGEAMKQAKAKAQKGK